MTGLMASSEPEQGLGAADPAALAEIVQRVDRAVDLHATHRVGGGRHHLVQAGAGRPPVCAASTTTSPSPMVTLSESTTRTGSLSDSSRAAWRAASMVADSLDDRVTQTTPVGALVGHAFERPDERAGRRRRRLGQLRCLGDPGPELLGGQLHPVDQLLGSEADGQRHHPHPELSEQFVGQVTGTVGDQADPGHVPPSCQCGW